MNKYACNFILISTSSALSIYGGLLGAMIPYNQTKNRLINTITSHEYYPQLYIY